MRRWINPLVGSRLDTGLARGERSVETVGRLADDVGATPPARRRRLAPFPRASARLRRGTNKRSGGPVRRTSSTTERSALEKDEANRFRRCGRQRIPRCLCLCVQGCIYDGVHLAGWRTAARLLTATSLRAPRKNCWRRGARVEKLLGGTSDRGAFVAVHADRLVAFARLCRWVNDCLERCNHWLVSVSSETSNVNGIVCVDSSVDDGTLELYYNCNIIGHYRC